MDFRQRLVKASAHKKEASVAEELDAGDKAEGAKEEAESTKASSKTSRKRKAGRSAALLHALDEETPSTKSTRSKKKAEATTTPSTMQSTRRSKRGRKPSPKKKASEQQDTPIRELSHPVDSDAEEDQNESQEEPASGEASTRRSERARKLATSPSDRRSSTRSERRPTPRPTWPKDPTAFFGTQLQLAARPAYLDPSRPLESIADHPHLFPTTSSYVRALQTKSVEVPSAEEFLTQLSTELLKASKEGTVAFHSEGAGGYKAAAGALEQAASYEYSPVQAFAEQTVPAFASAAAVTMAAEGYDPSAYANVDYLSWGLQMADVSNGMEGATSGGLEGYATEYTASSNSAELAGAASSYSAAVTEGATTTVPSDAGVGGSETKAPSALNNESDTEGFLFGSGCKPANQPSPQADWQDARDIRGFDLLLVGGVRKVAFVESHLAGKGNERNASRVDDCITLVFHSNRGPIQFNVRSVNGRELVVGTALQCECAIIVFDLTNQITYMQATNWHRDITRVCGNIPIVLVGSNAESKDRKVKSKQIEAFNIPYFDTSVKSNYNLEAPFLKLARTMTGDTLLHFVRFGNHGANSAASSDTDWGGNGNGGREFSDDTMGECVGAKPAAKKMRGSPELPAGVASAPVSRLPSYPAVEPAYGTPAFTVKQSGVGLVLGCGRQVGTSASRPVKSAERVAVATLKPRSENARGRTRKSGSSTVSGSLLGVRAPSGTVDGASEGKENIIHSQIQNKLGLAKESTLVGTSEESTGGDGTMVSTLFEEPTQPGREGSAGGNAGLALYESPTAEGGVAALGETREAAPTGSAYGTPASTLKQSGVGPGVALSGIVAGVSDDKENVIQNKLGLAKESTLVGTSEESTGGDGTPASTLLKESDTQPGLEESSAGGNDGLALFEGCAELAAYQTVAKINVPGPQTKEILGSGQTGGGSAVPAAAVAPTAPAKNPKDSTLNAGKSTLGSKKGRLSSKAAPTGSAPGAASPLRRFPDANRLWASLLVLGGILIISGYCCWMQLQLNEKDNQVAELAKELVETQKQLEVVVQQWQERSEELETNIAGLKDTIQEQEKGANDAIAEWEARCATLHEKIECLELDKNVAAQAQLKKELQELREQLLEEKTITNHMKELQGRLEETEMRLLEARTEVVASKETQTEMFGRVGKLLDKIEEKDAQVRMLTAEKETVQGYYDEMTVMNQKLLASKDEAANNLAELQKRLRNTEDDALSVRAEKSSLDKLLEEAKEELVMLSQKNENEKEAASESERRHLEAMSRMQGQLQELQEEKTALAKTVVQLQNDLTESKTWLDSGPEESDNQGEESAEGAPEDAVPNDAGNLGVESIASGDSPKEDEANGDGGRGDLSADEDEGIKDGGGAEANAGVENLVSRFISMMLGDLCQLLEAWRQLKEHWPVLCIMCPFIWVIAQYRERAARVLGGWNRLGY